MLTKDLTSIALHKPMLREMEFTLAFPARLTASPCVSAAIPPFAAV